MATQIGSMLPHMATALTAVVTLIALYISSRMAYNAFLHPLRHFPGPLLHRTTYWPWAYRMARGQLAWHVADLHKNYGTIVRITPNELALLEPEAWKDIYGLQPGGTYLEKYMPTYRPAGRLAPSIISAAKDEHSVLRKLMAPAFSEKSMREQEPVIGHYVDLLIERLRERAGCGESALNIRDWYNFTTFDVIGRLAFGQDFGCLEGGQYHPWVTAIFIAIREGGLFLALSAIGLKPLLGLISKGAGKNRRKHHELTRQKLQSRIEKGSPVPDIIGRLIDKRAEFNFSFDALRANASALTLAGSETTATLLTGVTYLLLAHPDHLRKVTEEIRSSFNRIEDITLTSVSGLSYMLACLNEALRIYPPVPIGLPRVVPSGGKSIAGTHIPENTVVSVWSLAMYRSRHYFRQPDNYCPERFLGDERFSDDRLDAIHAFSLGPRDCIGRSLAYAEMRLILAKIIFSFDLSLADDSKNWIERNRVYSLWSKPDLNVYITSVINAA